MNNCGCYRNSYIIEEEIPDIKTVTNFQVKLPVPELDINYVKQKTINDVLEVIQDLECGTQPELEIILQEISLIEIYGDIKTT